MNPNLCEIKSITFFTSIKLFRLQKKGSNVLDSYFFNLIRAIYRMESNLKCFSSAVLILHRISSFVLKCFYINLFAAFKYVDNLFLVNTIYKLYAFSEVSIQSEMFLFPEHKEFIGKISLSSTRVL